MIEDVPNIQACCAECKFLYDMRFGYSCPRCHCTRIAWARKVSNEEYRTGRMQSLLDEWAAKSSPPFHLNEGDKLDIEELDKIFALEDRRTPPNAYNRTVCSRQANNRRMP